MPDQCHNHAGILEVQGKILLHLNRVGDALDRLENSRAAMREDIDQRLGTLYDMLNDQRAAIRQLGFRSAWSLAHPIRGEAPEGIDESHLLG